MPDPDRKGGAQAGLSPSRSIPAVTRRHLPGYRDTLIAVFIGTNPVMTSPIRALRFAQVIKAN
jgi:hypothetical protein